MSDKSVTIIIPVFKLKEDRINNLKFVLPFLEKIECKVLVVEQTDKKESELTPILSQFPFVDHKLFVTNEQRFHKSGIINWAVMTHVTTQYAWVNDVDCYIRFADVLKEEWKEKFIQPYSTAKKLSQEDTKDLLEGKEINVKYDDENSTYISMYGALSFIFDVGEFISMGAMNENIYGWGEEDVELNERVKEKNIIQKLEIKAIHLWHPIQSGTIDVIEDQNLGTDLAVIVCHFNWCGFKTPVKNLNRFLSRMEHDKVPVYGIELSLSDEFFTAGRKNWKHIKVTKENVCFQKEACINLIEKEIPERYTKIAWIDGDLYFTNKNWYEDTSKALDTYKLVQMFENGIDTDSLGKEISSVKGFIYSGGILSENINTKYPGGAIAARREFFKNGGLYPFSFMGAGDTILMWAIYDIIYKDENETSTVKYHLWKEKIQAYINKTEVSYISGNFIHDWHGDRKNRNYHSRRRIISKVNLDSNLILDPNGLLRIITDDKSVYNEILGYFKSRLEDGQQVTEVVKTEKRKDMAVIAVHFNWAGFKTPLKNLNRFIIDIEGEGIPLYGIELSLTGKFQTEKYPNWLKMRVSKENVCFQKEACINLVEKYIPSKYTKIAWIDHDVYFKNRDWYNQASIELDSKKIIQLFSDKISTDQNGFEVSTVPALLKVGSPELETETGKYLGTPGVALAARRDLWNNGGLYPFCILGGGDSALMYSIYDNIQTNPRIYRSAGLNKPFPIYYDWKKQILKYVNRSCGYIPGGVVHFWHGDNMKRRYDDRYMLIPELDWGKSVRLNKYGLVEITNVESLVYDRIMNYFKSREEDGEIL